MYKYADKNIGIYEDTLRGASGKSTSNLTLKDALFNYQYRKSTWINIGYIIFHELTGINIILLYSSTIFKEMKKSGSSNIDSRQATQTAGIVNMIGSLISVWLVKHAGRRTLIVWGHIVMAILHAMVGVFGKEGDDTGVVVMIFAFLFVYQNTSGPACWLYAAETANDAALGICLLTLWGTVFILSQVCPILME